MVGCTVGWITFSFINDDNDFYPVNMQHSSCKHVFSIKVENSVDPDQMASFKASCSGPIMFF